MGRIVIFGATGYTGGLVARALVRDGAEPVLAGRGRERLLRLAEELGGLDIAVADAAQPDGTIRRVLDAGDVLVSTVGPFLRFGGAAVRAAVGAGAHYLDSTGEPPFVRWVFEEMDDVARGRCALITACGFEYVPGNLAGALALREGGPETSRVDVAYFSQGAGRLASLSAGTARSAAGLLFEPAFAWRDGRLQQVRSAERVESFRVGGEQRDAFSLGGSEHLALPRIDPSVREVNVYLGWAGRWTRPLQRAAAGTHVLGHVPGVRWFSQNVAAEIAGRVIGGRSGDDEPDLGASHVVAVAYDRRGDPRAEVHLAGPDGYEFTGEVLAWGARQAASEGTQDTGALGPVEAFGLDALETACAQIGLRRVEG